jgi:hypothetical protein
MHGVAKSKAQHPPHAIPIAFHLIQASSKPHRLSRFIALSSPISTKTSKMVEPKDTVITLKGSVEIVSEFFFTAINSILYQRGELLVFSVAMRVGNDEIKEKRFPS